MRLVCIDAISSSTVCPVSRFIRALLILDRRADVNSAEAIAKSDLPFRVGAVTKRGACMHHHWNNSA
jgi:hypothetical protein